MLDYPKQLIAKNQTAIPDEHPRRGSAAHAAFKKSVCWVLLGLWVGLFCAGCDKPQSKTASRTPAFTAIRLIAADGKTIDLENADIHIYRKEEFDAAAHAAIESANQQRESSIADASEQVETMEVKVRFLKLAKEQKLRAKETVSNMLTEGGDTSHADEFRREMGLYDREIDAVQTAIDQNQPLLDLARRKEAHAKAMTPWEIAATAALKAAPKPLWTTGEGENSLCKTLLSGTGTYLIIENAGRGSLEKVKFYWTDSHTPSGTKPDIIALKEYDLLANDAK